MDKVKINAAARKELIAADQNYYAWPEQQQERFRATMDAAAQSRVEAVLLKTLLGIQCTAENVGEIWRDLPLSKLNNLNWAKLLTTGIDDDYLFLNESMAENTSLLDFETLYDYDHDDHPFQEQSNAKESKTKNREAITPSSNACEIGRNEPCPCGSGGKEYKKCCGGN